MNEITKFPQIDTESVPRDEAAESQVIGCLLLRPEGIAAVLEGGGADLFYYSAYRAIFEAMEVKDRRGDLISPVTISRAPELSRVIADMGGPEVLVSIAGLASQGWLKHSIDVLAKVRTRRDLLFAVQQARLSLSDGGASVADVAASLDAAVQSAISGTSNAKPVSMMAATTKALEQIHDAYHGNAPKHVKSGIVSIDRLISGFYPGDLILLGGRPAMGKTALALSMALNAARTGHPVIFASLEMTPESMALRALSEASAGAPGATFDYSSARRGQINEEQMRRVVEVSKELAQLPIYFLPREFADSSRLHAGIKRVLGRYSGDKAPLTIVDYLQLMRNNGANRYEKITAVSQDLKDTAMRMQCPVLALTQLSRQVEQRDDKRPVLSDIRESGQLEQDADAVLFCYRDEYYLTRDEPDPSDLEARDKWHTAIERVRNQMDVIVAKQRQGQTGTAHIRFNPALNLIWED